MRYKEANMSSSYITQGAEPTGREEIVTSTLESSEPISAAAKTLETMQVWSGVLLEGSAR